MSRVRSGRADRSPRRGCIANGLSWAGTAPERFLDAWRVLRVGEEEVPEGCEALDIRVTALGDQSGDSFGPAAGDTQADRRAVIVEVNRESVQVQLLDQTFGDLGEPVEAVLEVRDGGHRGVAEADVVRRRQVVVTGQIGDEVTEHVRTGGEAVQQQQRRFSGSPASR